MMTVNWAVAISLLGLLVTSWYYVNMLTLTQQLQQANTLNAMHAEYSSSKTLEALEILEEFIDERGVVNYAFDFLELRRKRDAKGRAIDRARRHLTQWFSRVQYFYEFGYLKHEYILRFPGPERSRHFLHLIEPLEFISRRATGRKHSGVFDFLREVYQMPHVRLSDEFRQTVEQMLPIQGEDQTSEAILDDVGDDPLSDADDRKREEM
ncbi:hypothetical protein, conserved [Eimeria maxima]|uniref:Uncharacterized protein n=1 Tax=Eimeria maxima TaxID=5804 RepID=U6MES9_EIMMA|nr:hypothetical protein, conserved [Eimeria maxima]CDJ60979.1 hypothetical protein, conserved [Eimeria maxima]